MQNSTHRPVQNPPEASFFARAGFLGTLKILGALLIFLLMALFYTLIPIAGLGLLPFLFFGCVCLVVGVADDLGLY